ncbi:alpha-(1,6)-fucosyltransferase [Condylostylus longicornis]|uniref:alpha-(1,6)-fucosyltransferase n=1 Tax=Condylostylus longicornis TaxID=2530218 RepID=UPI00244DF401|nr:alpha-(1,6)-fucosyltransferase [Condylostylus longicornis]
MTLRFLNSSNGSIRALLIVIVLWAFLVYLFAIKLLNPQYNSDPDDAVRRVNQALKSLEESRQRNVELTKVFDFFISEDNKEEQVKLLRSIENPNFGRLSSIGAPSSEYEQIRRRIRTNTQEFWNFFSSELEQIRLKCSKTNPDLLKQINNILELGAEHKRSLLNDQDRMRELDGYESWRKKESEDLSNLVQNRLYYLQNPKDCKNAKKLVCKLNKGCGYGCQLHHVVYCFIVAYATERTLILKSRGWRYHKGGWEEVFDPISSTCTNIDTTSATAWPGHHNSEIVILPIIDSLVPRPPYLPLSVPEDLAPRLIRLHGDPIVWWVGQFLKYLLKPKSETKELLQNGMAKLGWKTPIVGVHVRRTDKVGTEAAFHSIDEYMSYVEDYYLTLEMNNTRIVRRIFLASDDPRVISEAKNKYPQYEILGDYEVAKMAAVSTRYTDSSLNGIILDIHMLSLCDYLVCTFSSQVCRVAYEIMQTLYPDASHRFKSLDDIYYYGGQNAHNRIAVLPHKRRNKDEIHLNVGDSIGIAGNHWNGFSKGKNKRTNEIGLFPSFKVNDKVEKVKLPTYPNV